MIVIFFFFFKQKTAYEMRISDWSSDVCSSDLSSSLDGKVAFVTGADRNLGKAMATALLRDGANVVATAMYGSLLSQFVEECGAADRVLTLEGDISRDDDRQRLVQAAIDRRSEEHTSELQSLMRNSYAVFCLKQKKKNKRNRQNT